MPYAVVPRIATVCSTIDVRTTIQVLLQVPVKGYRRLAAWSQNLWETSVFIAGTKFCTGPMSDAHSGMQAHVALSICGQVSHKAYAAGLFTSAWPRSKYRKDDIRAAALLAVLKV